MSNFWGLFFPFFGVKKIFKKILTLFYDKTPFSHGAAQTSAHSPKSISHIEKFWDQTSVLLSVLPMHGVLKILHPIK